jgi:hypothetical protein
LDEIGGNNAPYLNFGEVKMKINLVGCEICGEEHPSSEMQITTIGDPFDDETVFVVCRNCLRAQLKEQELEAGYSIAETVGW